LTGGNSTRPAAGPVQALIGSEFFSGKGIVR